ncbi:MAG: hypothetical protein A3D15_05905 [Alphaproteobacteria bacterium RIFCSPHIGHO2_02_FULL_40_34]|nr:MAG: hypothetical protein A3D15_05905 [Alphaproteobacteria bacterium RIFCSPHIGHO2_02_FULL_40_34]OFX11454.1 MAG: hypothetical protein A3G22_02075 [Alphaproteobacteria bacterium RIFCSPLOWO2_12_FULL_40_11]
MFSIFLAKKFPFLKIFAFEPVFENWRSFKRNIKINNVEGRIKLYNLAISGAKGFVKLTTCMHNTGASSMIDGLNVLYNPNPIKTETVKSITLDQVFCEKKINHCKLLKIDCEGAEFEILYNCKNLDKIEYIVGETHSFDQEKNNRKSLLEYLGKRFNQNKMQFSGF